MPSYCLDTHALIWHLEDNPRLGNVAREILNTADVKLILPAIALAEACYIVAKGKTAIVNWQEIIKAIADDPRVEIAPLTTRVIQRASELPLSLEMHDAQIVATSLIYKETLGEVPVITKDEVITRSGLVSVTW